MTTVTQNLLKELFEYNDGVFYWKVARQGIKCGQIAGSLFSNGYRRIKINGKCYLEHRLVWLFHKGEFPKNEIDHVNGNIADNRIENLREATRSENSCNRKTPIDNTTGFKGVCFNKQSQKYQGQIIHKRTNYYCGVFDTPEDAYAAVCLKRTKLHGEFANHD